MIRSQDNFLPEELYKRVMDEVNSTPLTYGWKSNHFTDPHGHWNIDIAKRNSQNLANIEFNISGIYKEVWDYYKENIPELVNAVPIRCYINVHTYGTDGYIHTDSIRDDETTIVMYILDGEWNPDWAGETIFLDDNGDIEKAVLPKKNRISLFYGKKRHAGRAVSRSFFGKRVVLVYKTRNKRTPEFEILSQFLVEVGTLNFKHSVGSLHDHLCRAYELLNLKGYDQYVCYGGGLHSIYGTNSFKNQTLSYSSRDIVKEIFGDKAENLAYIFSQIDRPKALENAVANQAGSILLTHRDTSMDPVIVDPKTYLDLCRIECANLLDQDSINKGIYPVIAGTWT
jgi:SM-20-related protein